MMVYMLDKLFFQYFSGEPHGCASCSRVCQNRNGGNGANIGSFDGGNYFVNGGINVAIPIYGLSSSISRSPSCGKKRSKAFTRNGCIYECDGNIRGSGTCATERSGTCGSCFGREWQGGHCS